jgi:GPH family glycoside/pentoside/hexuronide:cation symporter
MSLPSESAGSTTSTLKRHATAPEDRVPIAQKIGYGLGTFPDMWGHWLYPTIAFQIFGLFLHVPQWQLGVAVILNRVFDAVSDPLFGWLSDNARSRWGRRRPFMLAGSVLAAIGLPFLLAVTPGWGTTDIFGLHISKYFWFMLASSAIYLPMVSCFNMPYQSLGMELTPDYHERTSVFSFKNALQKIPEVGLFMFGRFFSTGAWVGADASNVFGRVRQMFTSTKAWETAPDGASPNLLLGAQAYLVMCGIIILIVGLICTFLVRERYYNKLVATTHVKISIRETLWQTLQCRPFRIQLGMQLAYNMGLSMVGTLGYVATLSYVCLGNNSVANFWNSWMGLANMPLGFLGIPVFAFVARYFGKLHSLMAVLWCAVAVFIGTWWLYTPSILWLQMFASGLIAFIGAGYWTIMGSIGADVMDYDELESGRRREGSFAACGSWINKFGMAVGAGFGFFILQWIGFDSTLTIQTPHTIFMIRFLLAAIPIIGLFLALIALARFPLTQEKMAEIRQQLEARRGKV